MGRLKDSEFNFCFTFSDSQISEDQKYHSLFFQLIDLTIDEIKFKFQDPHLLSIIHIVEILRSTNERSVRSLKELNMFKDLINFEELEDEMECWQTLSKQSTILEICKKTKSKKIETQLQKVRTIQNKIFFSKTIYYFIDLRRS